MRFKDKVCIVTGATSGIGRVTAERLAQEGAKLLLVGLDDEQGRQVCGDLLSQSVDAQFAGVDLADAAAIERAIQLVVASTYSLTMRLQ